MSSEEAIRRADLARQVLDNELYQDAIAALGESIRRQRLVVKPSDTEGQRNLIIAEQLLDKLAVYLHRSIEDGKQAQLQLVSQPLLHRVFAR